MKNGPFWAHLTLQILDRDENHFLMNIFQNLVPNSNLRPLLAELKFHAPAFRTEKHFPPAGPASTQEILIPCAGVAPPLQYRHPLGNPLKEILKDNLYDTSLGSLRIP